MERRETQAPELKYTRDPNGVLLEYFENADGTVEWREIQEATAPSNSGFELNFRAYGDIQDIPRIMKQFGAQMAAPALSQQPTWNPETPDAPAAYDRPGFYAGSGDETPAYSDDEWHDEATQLVPTSFQPQEIAWNEPEIVQPKQKRERLSGKKHARATVVLATMVIVGAGIAIDGHHAVHEAPANTAACADKAGFFGKITTLPCVGVKFALDMAEPFKDHNAPDTASKKESK